jgi:cell division protein FtsA
MAKRNEKELIVGLDIGTTKIAAIVGAVSPAGEVEIIGIGTHPSEGLRKGVVVNIEATVRSIQRAVEEAEVMADCEIHSVFAGIAGSHIKSMNSHGIVKIRSREVTHYDIESVLDAARAIAIPNDEKILHVLPQQFIVDSQDGILEPTGMAGVRLEVKAHIVRGSVSAAANIERCVRLCGLDVEDVVLEPLASSYAVLNADEKELGVCMVDIGGGTTDVAVFAQGAIRHTDVIPIAGNQVTNDIAVFLRTPMQNAEDIKKRYACAISQMVSPSEQIEVPSIGDRPARRLSRQSLAEVVGPRYEELFMLVQAELVRHGFDRQIPAGIVLTGGGSKIEGAVELAEEIFHRPVRLGAPQEIAGLRDVVRNPIHSTGVGLLLYGHEFRQQGAVRAQPGMRSMLDRMRGWFRKNF